MEDSASGGRAVELFEAGVPLIADVTSQSLGVIQLDGDSTREVNTVVIPRNSKIPAKLSVDGFTVVDNQTSINVQVTEGDDTDPEFVVEIGSKELAIPPYPKGSPVRVTYAYDIDQTVFVELTDLTAGRSLGTFTLDRRANLTDEQVRTAAGKVAALSVQ